MIKFHKIISLIFQPLFMPTFGMMLLMNMSVFSILPNSWRWIAIAGTFIFTAILPAIPIFLMYRRGEISDVSISNRQERTMPYLFSFLSYCFWSLFLWKTMQFPLFIVSMGVAAGLSIFIIVFINLKWKISAHLAGMGGLTAAVFGVSYRMAINPLWMFTLLFLISALVAISRIELNAHTPTQLLAGFVLSFILVFSACLIF
jgi:hypothetical protein